MHIYALYLLIVIPDSVWIFDCSSLMGSSDQSIVQTDPQTIDGPNLGYGAALFSCLLYRPNTPGSDSSHVETIHSE